MKAILSELIEHRSLDQATAKQVLVDLATGKYNPSQLSAFMTVYMMRAITLEELRGFRDAILDMCVPVHFDAPVIDLCGTGGDGKNTFNISTLASFVVAGAGQPVAKHGNYAASSVSGSSNVLEYFGFRFTSDLDQLECMMDRANIAFLHAPLFHPAMKNVGPIRRELGVKTFFNMLGPMVNPASPSRQLVGVYSLELARQYNYLYQDEKKRFAIVYDLHGFDEVSLTGQFKLFSNEGEKILEPADLGFLEVSPSSLGGGQSVEESAKVFLQILEGEGTHEQNNVVIANAGLALHCADSDLKLESAIARARESLESGQALKAFKKLFESQGS